MIEIERHLKPAKEISVIPLINVVFLLLIFFLVAGSVEKFNILKIDVPLAESGTELNQGHILIVLGRHKEIILDDYLANIDDISPWLKAKLKVNSKRQITIKPDAKAKASDLIKVIEIIKMAGGKNLTLAVQRP